MCLFLIFSTYTHIRAVKLFLPRSLLKYFLLLLSSFTSSTLLPCAKLRHYDTIIIHGITEKCNEISSNKSSHVWTHDSPKILFRNKFSLNDQDVKKVLLHNCKVDLNFRIPSVSSSCLLTKLQIFTS